MISLKVHLFLIWGVCLRKIPFWKFVGSPWKEGDISFEAGKDFCKKVVLNRWVGRKAVLRTVDHSQKFRLLWFTSISNLSGTKHKVKKNGQFFSINHYLYGRDMHWITHQAKITCCNNPTYKENILNIFKLWSQV